MHGAEGVVDTLLIADGKGGERLGRGVVTGVGLRRGETLLQRIGADGRPRAELWRLAREAALAVHVEAAVPPCRPGGPREAAPRRPAPGAARVRGAPALPPPPHPARRWCPPHRRHRRRARPRRV